MNETLTIQKEFTKQFMIDNFGCYSNEQLMKCSFMNKNVIHIDDIINSEIRLKDKYWFVCKKLATKEQNQQIAIGVAEIVLIIYENKYPDNKAPREAIQTAKDYLAGIINIDELRQKRAADYAYTADAVAAVDAAAYAAAAAYAVDAAAYADKKTFTETLLQFLKDFIKNN